MDGNHKKLGKWIGRPALWALVLSFCAVTVAAQHSCYKYTESIRAGRAYLQQDSFDRALTEFQAALVAVRECRLTESDRKDAQLLLERAFDGLEEETNDAIEARERAVQTEYLALRQEREAEAARDAAVRALTQANELQDQQQRLLNALYFYEDRFALAVGTGTYGSTKFGFIDKEGEVRINYQYDEAEPFDNHGLARVVKDKQTYLIDTTDRKFLLAESLEELSTETEALDLSGQRLDSFPDTILNFPQLKVLLLNNNQLTELPEACHLLKNLEWLNISTNLLRELPASIGQLQQLRVFVATGDPLPALVGKVAKESNSIHERWREEDAAFRTTQLKDLATIKELELKRTTLSTDVFRNPKETKDDLERRIKELRTKIKSDEATYRDKQLIYRQKINAKGLQLAILQNTMIHANQGLKWVKMAESH